MADQFKLARPVDSKFRVTQYFGENPDVYKKFGQAGHEGVDFGLPVGENIYSCADGEVFDVRPDNSAYGIHVRVRHLFGGREYHTIYAHMSKALVSKGQSVKAGEVLGLSGNTGHSFGPHLHFTLKLIGASTSGYPKNIVDPWPYLEGHPPVESKPLEPSDLTIYTTDKVRMRGGPTTASAEVAWLESGEALTVLGDAKAAKAKVGQSGEWIPARRADGTDGYVAAWYAQVKAAAAPTPEQVTEPAPEPTPTPTPKPTEKKPESKPAPAGDLVVYATEPLNVREGPAANTARIAVALPDEALVVIGDLEEAKANIGDRGDWLQVRLADGSESYVAAWYVQIQPGAAVESLTVYPTEDMNMRNRPDTSGDLVTRVPHNSPLKIHDGVDRAKPLVGQHGEWLYVETKDGKRGWVAAWYVSTSTT
ncbi:MAG: M23 family metallopeptidase [Chloroflexi bacterium]|nr:M23 family metallopeptidase [Chloroflexota bacterium]